MHENLGIAAGLKQMSASYKILQEFAEVIDFAVEDNLYGSVFISEWLIAPGHVDDAKAAVPERDIGIEVISIRVWPSVDEAIAHIPDQRVVQRRLAFSHVTCYATHANNLTRRSRLRVPYAGWPRTAIPDL